MGTKIVPTGRDFHEEFEEKFFCVLHRTSKPIIRFISLSDIALIEREVKSRPALARGARYIPNSVQGKGRKMKKFS